MKKFILLLAVLILSTDFSYTNPPDNCLWAPILGNEAFFADKFWDDAFDNSDSSLFIDTCGLWELDSTLYLDSGKHTQFPDLKAGPLYESYKRYYSNSFWVIKFDPMSAIQIIDTVNKDLNQIEYFTVDDIDSSFKEIYDGLQQARIKYGEIKIRVFPTRNISINEQLALFSKPSQAHNIILETEKIVNSIEFAEFLGTKIEEPCIFEHGLSYPVSVKEKNKMVFKVSSNHSNFHIESEIEIKNIGIYAVNGIKIKDIFFNEYNKFEANIDISALSTGIYFILINNTSLKFSIVR